MKKLKDIILITGANGHLAKVTANLLSKEYQIRFLTTKKILTKDPSFFYWNIDDHYIDQNALKGCKHIIHLAGYPILKRWTDKNKKQIYNSRILSTNLLFKNCKLMKVIPETFICASAIGIYDQSIKSNVNENSQKGDDWIGKMACEWENSSNKFKSLGSRVIQMRISLIFSKHAGFLKYAMLSMKFGIGLIIGNRDRIINWIHVDDICMFINRCINDNNMAGPYNLSSYNRISQEELIHSIKNHLFPYAIVIQFPIFLTRLFIGKRVQIINTNLSLDTDKLKNSGFKFKFKTFKELMINTKN